MTNSTFSHPVQVKLYEGHRYGYETETLAEHITKLASLLASVPAEFRDAVTITIEGIDGNYPGDSPQAHITVAYERPPTQVELEDRRRVALNLARRQRAQSEANLKLAEQNIRLLSEREDAQQ